MNRPWMPLYVADYIADTAHLDAAESGAYLHLIMHYWLNGVLPQEDRHLARIARMTDRQWASSRDTIAAFFHDGWRHKRIDDELAKAADISNKRRASVNQRRIKSPTNDPTIVDQSNTHAGASSQPQSKKDAADAAPSNLEKQLFERGKEVAGKDAGGLIVKLLKAKKGNVSLARSAVEMAATKGDPREYLGAIIAGGHASSDGKRLSNDEVYWGQGRTPGII